MLSRNSEGTTKRTKNRAFVFATVLFPEGRREASQQHFEELLYHLQSLHISHQDLSLTVTRD